MMNELKKTPENIKSHVTMITCKPNSANLEQKGKYHQNFTS